MVERTDKVYAQLGLSTQFIVCQLFVLDTGAALNLIHKRLIPRALRGNIGSEPSLTIADANNNPLLTAGNIIFFASRTLFGVFKVYCLRVHPSTGYTPL